MELDNMTLAELRELAKEKGIEKYSSMRKADLIKKLTAAEAPATKPAKPAAKAAKPAKAAEAAPAKKPAEKPAGEKAAERPRQAAGDRPAASERKPASAQGERPRQQAAPDKRASYSGKPGGNTRSRYHDGSDGLISVMRDRQIEDVPPTELKDMDSGITKNGILEIMMEGYGFIRCDNYLPGEDDVYVSPQFIRRFGLRTGDIITGNLRKRTQNEKFSALLYMKKVNDLPPSYLYDRKKFENLTPIFPNQRIRLETQGAGVSMRMLDLIAPIGKGQRGMIVSQPKTGKTTLIKQVARAVTRNHPDMKMIILLIDERPEEVTDIKESIEGNQVEVIYSTFDELPENHKRVSEMVIERAKRLVESGEDVMILLDSITRLARAYNLTVTPSGRTLSGGLDPAALHMPKRFFGAARNMREGGSLTILATALVDTGSRMDDVVFEEFKGTGNMELMLDRSLSERRIFPAIDITKSSTRREDLLLSTEEQECVIKVRRILGGMRSDQAMEQVLDMFRRTRDNNEFIEMVKKIRA
ncbi:MAG: transcription termination factor Rho [Eubacterium sp.]|nr:transcription termination factor Rho [Eubacterium sp.]